MSRIKEELGSFKTSQGSANDFITSYHNATNLSSNTVEALTNDGNSHFVLSEHMLLNKYIDLDEYETDELKRKALNQAYEKSNSVSKDVISRVYGRDTDDDVDDAFEMPLSDMPYYTSGTVLSDPETMLTNRFNKFGRFGYLDPTHELITGVREYIFFSKPDLHLVEVNNPGTIYSELKGVPLMREAFDHYKLSYYSLQQYFGNKSSLSVDGLNIDLDNLYVNLLSNMVTSSMDLSDISASDSLNNQNLFQVNTSYREGSISSDLQYDFSLEFKDTKYLDVYMFFKIYDEYFRQKYNLEIEPTRGTEYIMSKIYPEAMAIWKIIVDDTNRILYWAKATGVTPMSVPRGTISNLEGTVKFTINWKAQFVRDMDPVNLFELNALTARSMGIAYGTSDSIANVVLQNARVYPDSGNNTWVGYPLIVSEENGIHSTTRTGHNTTTKASKFRKLVWVDKL